MAYADLGGLGTKQGPAADYDWVAPSLLPAALPWLAILVLLLPKRNRCASAWWVCVPLACVAGVTNAPHPVVGFLPSSVFDMLLELISALGFGAAAVWLLSAYLAWKHRMLALLGILAAEAGFSLLAFAHCLERETAPMVIPLLLACAVISVGLTLAGLMCRGRYGWLRVGLATAAALVLLCLLAIGPFFLMEAVGRADMPTLALFVPVGMVAGITFGTLLPFLVLSFANAFYRERLKALLHLGAVAPPPVINPPMPTVPAAA